MNQASIPILIAFVQSLGTMALLTLAYSWVTQYKWPGLLRSFLIGALFGVGAIIAMLSPFELRPGVIIDGRNTIVAIGAAFGGPLGAVLSTGIAAIYRIELGGEGVAPGSLGIVLAGAIGYFWSVCFKPRISSATIRLSILALMMPFCLAGLFVLPWAHAIEGLQLLWLPSILSSFFVAIVLGALMEQRESAIAIEHDLRVRAETDSLTGLMNRHEFEKQLNLSLRTQTETRPSVALLIIDADNFKSVNDRYGHAIGDLVLRGISEKMMTAVGPEDIAARLGGEEFGILLKTPSPNRTLKVAERIRTDIAGMQFSIKDKMFSTTVSVGGAVARKGETFDTLYEAADKALYTAKGNGRNKTHLAIHERSSDTTTFPASLSC